LQLAGFACSAHEVRLGLFEAMAAWQPYTVIPRAMHIDTTVSAVVPALLQQLKPLA